MNKHIRVKAELLHEVITKKLMDVSVNQCHAETVASALVYADLRGIYSHGSLRTEHYLSRIKQGGINLDSNFKIENMKQSIGMLDADGGLGHVATLRAMKWAISASNEHGISAIGIKNSSHCGALSYYNSIALQDNKISILMANSDIATVPFGGTKPFFGTNAISYGIPAKDDFILGDLATSASALGKILAAREDDEQIPLGWAIDKDGSPTTNPHSAKYLLPFGGAKGYTIMMMVEAFTGLLIGGVYGPHLVKMYGDLSKKRNLSSFILVIDPGVFGNLDSFLNLSRSFIDELRSQPTAEGVSGIFTPGQRRERFAKEHQENGIPIIASVYKFLFE